VDWHNGSCRIAVVDALGHGPLAAEVAACADQALAANPQLDPVSSLMTCHRALTGTRGAAIGFVKIDPDSSQLEYAGIGNVELIVRTDGREHRLSSDRGIVGTAYRTPHPISIQLHPGWLLMMHSDGVSARMRIADVLEGATNADPESIAKLALQRWARPTDDATVVVACSPVAARP
jgi:serine phosphatase RsbU (regulator of sigma subunit)